MNEQLLLCLYDQLLAMAEGIAMADYGCDLDRLDPEHLEWYGSRLTEDNLEELANDLAHEAWQAY